MPKNLARSKQKPDLPDLLTADEAAAFLRLSPITLGHYRCRGRGPLYRKHGWRVYYTKADLVAWSDRQLWASTGEKIGKPR